MKYRILLCSSLVALPAPAGIWWNPEPPAIGYAFQVGATGEESGDYVYLNLYKNGACIAQSQGADSAWAYASVVTDGTTSFSAEKTAENNQETESIDTTVNATLFAQPFPPEGLQASSLMPTSFVLSWLPAVYHRPIAAYEVRLNGISLGGGILTSMTITGLTRGETYQAEVRALSNGNWSPWSAPCSVPLIDPTPPSVPGSLQSPAQTAASVSLAWSPSTDPNGMITYDVYLHQGGVAQYVGSPAMNATTFVHAQFPGGTYVYTVRARDTFGNASGASNAITVTTPPAADADSDGIPNHLEIIFGNANPTTANDAALELRIHRPQ